MLELFEKEITRFQKNADYFRNEIKELEEIVINGGDRADNYELGRYKGNLESTLETMAALTFLMLKYKEENEE